MKAIVLGFDGASPLLINRWLDQLPNLKKIKNQGCFGLSIPPVPAQTPVAWSTFITGMNPGKHGIFSFITKKPRSYEIRIASPSQRSGRTLWRILNDAGLSVGVINVPMSGLEPLKGFIIPGFLSRDEGVPYPEGVRRLVEREFGVQRMVGDVEVEVLKKVKQEPDAFWRRVQEITEQNFQIGLYLAENMQPDFFMQVFMGTDRIQHFFWKYVDENHPQHTEGKYTKRIMQYYKTIDQIIGTYLRLADDALLIVLSDHGFCHVHKVLPVNRHLKRAGLLKAGKDGIIWGESAAFSFGYGDIWLNVQGREPAGVVEPGRDYERLRRRVKEFFESLRFNGECPVKTVLRREDVFWGSRLEEAPDLIVLFRPGWQAYRDPEKELAGDAPTEPSERWDGGHDGAHDPQDVPGLLAITAPSIPKKAVRLHLWDIAPTILKWLGIKVPKQMDGKPANIRLEKH